MFRDRCCLVLHPRYVEGRENAANAARDADPSLRKKPKKTTKAADLATVPYEAYSRVSSHRCTILEILSQLQIRGVNPGHTTKKDALLRLWETNSDLPDKRGAAVVIPPAAAGGGVRPAAPAAAGGGVRPAAAAKSGGEELLASLRLPIFDGAAFSLNLPVDLEECLEPAAKADGGGDAPSSSKISPPARVVAKTRICAACKRTGHQRNSKKCPMHPSNVDVLDNDQLFAQ